ncbi:Cip2 [Coprinopsis cinerea okayama7|uniref:(4-O-methyl)-D-glucuronate--lignin esterase n=1 Tax=Coprinopsis cinerea (strain Okayama-7 / 130 / ATCC MYA-4618 / FGSC 9003) TaxID=240176 RepID=A8NB00_COPC7|nr:Cip2 [Coprinopsis cinerea okayama7\|eukprot:XP_001832002.2 Cip2 [Coprinopsis cinerea okayama7\
MDALKRPLVALALALPVLASIGSWTVGGAHDWYGDSYTKNIPSHLAPLDVSSGSDSLVRRQQPPNCAPPANPTLAPVERLNNPFVFLDGRPVADDADWYCRRQEIATLFQRYELGTLPPNPASVSASLSGTTLTINVASSNATTSFEASIEYPQGGGDGPFPAIIALGGSSLPTPAGVAVISFNNREIAFDSGPIGRGQGKFYHLYGAYHPAGALMAWTWAVSRIIDGLALTPGARIDVGKLAVTGCSVAGKGALVAGAFEPRIALTIPVESGTGGAGCWRIADDIREGGGAIVTASELANTTTYYSTSFNAFATNIPTLPIDHHLLQALVAPRGLLILDNSQYSWLGPASVFGCSKTANGVYRALGIGDRLGVSIVGGHDHCVFPGQQYPEFQAYINKFLRGIDGENTNVLKSDVPNNGGFDEAKFVNWTIPQLVAPPPPPPPPEPGVCDAPLDLDLTTPIPRLNNPFVFLNGSDVSDTNDWYCRRQEISSLFQRWELGYLPPRPSSVTGTLSGNTLTISVTNEGRTISFTASITYPEGNGPFPAIIAVGGSTIPAPAQVAIITFNNRELAVDDGTRGQGKFYDLYGNNHSAGVLMAWAWGVSRVIDAISSVPNSRIDPGKLGVTGCSNNGKAALIAGAFEQRLALTIPVETGTGGAGCWRLADDLRENGVGLVTARDLVSTTSYYATAFTPFAENIPTLPFDHHLLASLVAPRGLLVLDNSQYPWLGPPSVYGCMVTANKVYQALGIRDRLGVSIVGGHDHCVFPGQQYPELQAFVNKFLRGSQNENTNFIKTDVPNNGGFDEDEWVDWEVPNLIPVVEPPPPPPPGVCDAPLELDLTANPTLNNPFVFVNGSKTVENTGDWYCRRQEIGSLVQRFELGYQPENATTTGSLSGNVLTVNVSHEGRSITFAATITYPTGNGPFAALIGIGGSTVPQAPEIATITFNNQEIAVDNGVQGRGQGKFYDLYGSNHSAGALLAWAWAVSRVIDALAATPNVRIDVGKLGVTGCSASGKAALVAGAFDPRLSLTIPVESGIGGAGCWRIADDIRAGGGAIVTAGELANTTSYFTPAFAALANNIPTLPFDHHLLAAMVAPRGLLVLDNSQYSWLGPPAVYGCMVTANKVYQALGIRDRLGVSIVGGHDHCVFPGQQYPEFQAFINKFLRGAVNENTNYIKTDVPNNGGFDEAKWVNWQVPNLVPVVEPPPPPPPQVCDAPAELDLTPVSRLNNPFAFVNGSKTVETSDDWFCRRQEISNLFQRLELGFIPGRPTTVSGSLSGNTLTINVGHEGRSISFTATITYPQGNGPFAAIIGIGGSTLPPPPEVAVINFNNQEIAVDSGTTRAQGKFYDLYGANRSAGSLAAWAWAVSRIVDAVSSTPNIRIDAGKLAVTGCSAAGKAALVAGAFEQRIALTLPVESGIGGAGCWRIADDLRNGGAAIVTAGELANTTAYFSRDFNPFAANIPTLPFDHHLLAALVAPRGLLVLDNSQYSWLGPQSVYGCMVTANKVFQALGIRDRLGVSIVGGHDHCVFPGQQYPEYQAFVNKFLRGITSENTNVIKTDQPNNGGWDEAKWVDWTVPNLAPGQPPVEPPPPPPPQVCDAPAELNLSAVDRLNNPFAFVNGSKNVEDVNDWYCRRQEIGSLFQRLELGYVPARPSTVTGSISGNALTVTVGHEGRTTSFTANITYPQGNGPFAAIIGIGGSSVPAPPEVAIITFNNQEIAVDNGVAGRGQGKFYDLYGTGHTAGTLVAWSWAVSRIIDALQSTQNSRIDAGKLAVTGCSAAGKAALVAGAFEQRLSLTIPVESGIGGAGCWRVAEELRRGGAAIVTAGELANTTSYYSRDFNPFAANINTLPFDHHLLAAMVAPRGLLVLDNSQFSWLGPQAVYGCMVTANKVYQALGIRDRLGVSIVGGHDHCVFPGQQYPEFQAFINKFLRGITSENTNVIKTDQPNNGGWNESRWVDWTVPTLVPGQPPTEPPVEPPPPPPPQVCDAPAELNLSAVDRLNNPFAFVNGSKNVEDVNDWYCRRQEIGNLFQRLELGYVPAQPSTVTGSLSGNSLTVTVGHEGRTTSFTANITYPQGNGPFAAIIGIGGSTVPNPPEVAVITFNNQEIAVDNGVAGRGQGKFYDLYGTGHTAGSLVAWSWAVSRIIDALQSTQNTRIDVGKLAVTGCSAAGKAALVAGAFEQRLSLTIPVESGIGGAGCWRVAEELRRGGAAIVTAGELANTTSYYSRDFNPFAANINTLPFDHHLLAAMVAPRGLLVLDNSQYSWLGPQSVYGCMVTANKVYQALGIRDRLGVSIVGGHDHCVFPGQQYPEFQAFINKFLRGITSENTNVIKTDQPNNGGWNESRWVDWTVPTLVPGQPPTEPPVEPPAPPPPQTCDAPAELNLTAVDRLNNPFAFINGSKTVTTADDWYCRRQEISNLFQRLELGYVPPRPATVTGSLSGNSLTINVGHEGRSTSFTANITYPQGNGPFAAIIGIGGSTVPAPPEVAIITFNNQEIAVDNGVAGRGQGKFYDLYGTGHTAGNLVAWSWAVSRIIDALQSTQNTRIDVGKIAVTGCSAAGKAALVAGAFEQRISLTIPVESGIGGAGCWRVAEELRRGGAAIVTAGELANSTSYYSRDFNPFANNVNTLPFDHHLLAAMVAPRGLLVLDNSQYSWLGPQSVYGCMVTANKVYQALGIRDRLGVSIVGGHDHCVFPGQQYPEFQAFINKFLRGITSENTNVIKTDQPNNGGWDESRWVNWQVPNLAPGQPPVDPPTPPTPGSCSAPQNITLTPNTRLNNPFSFVNGSKSVTTTDDWFCRRQELTDLFQRYQLGTLPGRPSTVTGSLSGNTLTVSVSNGGQSTSFTASINYPTGDGPFPAFIAIGGSTLPQPAAVAVITFNNQEIAVDNGAASRGQGKFYDVYGSNHPAGALVAWSWAVSRIIDALGAVQNSRIDLGKLGVTGCSAKWQGRSRRCQYSWLGPQAVYGSAVSASRVYRSLGIADRLGVSIVGGHDHCVFPGQQYPEYQAFVNKFLRGSLTENTNFIKTDVPNNGGFDEGRWIDWTLPTLAPGQPPTEPPTQPPTNPNVCAAPQNLTLTANTRLTSPFTFAGSTRAVTSTNDWFCRRQELTDLFQRYELGTIPSPPSSVTGSISNTTLTVNVSHNGRSTSFVASITYPTVGEAPFPAIIGIGGSALPTLPGIAVITFNAQEIAVDNGAAARGQGKFYDLYGSDHSAGVLAAWSWAVSRVIDAAGSTQNSRIDASKIAVTGCSGSGKAALVAGAFDQRISLTIPQESGTGGAGCWRIADELLRNGQGIVTAAELVNSTAYFARDFNPFASQVNNLPFDHHLLAALVAPRGLLVLDNTQYSWLGPQSVYGCMRTANKIYESLGIADRMGVSLVGGHDHCVFPGQQYPELNAFVNKFLRGSLNENTNVIKTDAPNNGGFDESRWVDWTTPRLS